MGKTAESNLEKKYNIIAEVVSKELEKTVDLFEIIGKLEDLAFDNHYERDPVATLEKIRYYAQELDKEANVLESTAADLKKSIELKKSLLLKMIDNGEVKVAGVFIYALPSDVEEACFRCIGKLKNPDGTPFKLEQVAEQDIILDTGKSDISKKLSEKGCMICGFSPTPRDEVEDWIKNHPPYGECGRSIVYV